MDTRTGKVFDSHGRELSEDEIRQLKQKPIAISGENCTGYCALAHKRQCFTVDKKFRDRCTRFMPQRNVNY